MALRLSFDGLGGYCRGGSPSRHLLLRPLFLPGSAITCLGTVHSRMLVHAPCSTRPSPPEHTAQLPLLSRLVLPFSARPALRDCCPCGHEHSANDGAGDGGSGQRSGYFLW